MARGENGSRKPASNAFPGRKYAHPRHKIYQILIDFQLAGSTLIS